MAWESAGKERLLAVPRAIAESYSSVQEAVCMIKLCNFVRLKRRARISLTVGRAFGAVCLPCLVYGKIM